MHVVAEPNRLGLHAGPEGAGKQELTGRFAGGGPPEGGKDGGRVLLTAVLRIHDDGGAPGDEGSRCGIRSNRRRASRRWPSLE
jgi:hypothetical protein